MARDKTVYTCNACGGTSPKWLGKCSHCGEWNTLEESVAEATSGARHRFHSLAKTQAVATLSEIETSDVERRPTGLSELDRALGGGIVEGGVTLIGGDPGIGKSTLLLQAADRLAQHVKVLYVTGEESGAQVALRARPAGIERCAGARAGRDPARTHPRGARDRTAGVLRDRFDPDPVLGRS